MATAPPATAPRPADPEPPPGDRPNASRPASWLTPDALVELDLNTAEKLPVLAELLSGCTGPSLDLGSGLAYYSRRLLGEAGPTLAVDLDLTALGWARGPSPSLHPCRGDAGRLPLRPGSLGTVLLADVLEHCPDDRAVVTEIARVLRPGGRLVLSVPSIEWGFPDFLSLLGVESVHDREGPERHYQAGYTAAGLRELLATSGFEVIETRQIARFGSKLLIDSIALAHLVSERLGRGREVWTWGSLIASPPPGLRLYRRVFPALRLLHRGLRRLGPRRGFELAVAAERRA